MKYKLRYKLFSFLALAFLGTVMLASCSHTKVSSSIGGKEVYATSGKYTITNGELWNELKWNSYDFINEQIKRAVIKDEIAIAEEAIDHIVNGTATELSNAVLSRYYDFLEDSALVEIYELADIEDIKILTEKERNSRAQKFVDTVYLEDAKSYQLDDFTYDNLVAAGKTMFAGTRFEKKYYFSKFYNRYSLELARKIYANSELADMIKDYNKKADDKNEYYYTDDDIIQYQRENYQYSADRHALIIRFTNEDEIKSTLKAFGIKVYNNTFFYIPANGKKNVKYSEYYDKFTIEDPANSAYCVNLNSIGGDSLIFELYLQIYNYIYTYRDALPTEIHIANDTVYRRDITEAIIAKFKDDTTDPADTVAAWDQEYKDLLTYSQDDLNDVSDDFKLYVSETLKTEPNKADGEMRYSTAGKSYNGFSYMVFKLSEDELKDWYYLGPDSIFDDSNAEIDTTDSKVAAYRDELVEEMMWDELTDAEIDKYFDKKRDKAKVYIYDNDIEILYSSNKSTYSKTHKDAPSKNTLLTIKSGKNSTNVTVNEVFDELEKTSGTAIAIDLLSKKAIKDTEEYKDTNEDRKDYKRTIELLLSYFANGGLQGYDSSLGKYNFLRLYFHTTDIDKIIDNVYRVNDASAKILTNYANNTAFYELVQSYAKKSYDKAINISATNLLVYVDMDEDGKADTDFDWTKTDTNSGKTYKELAIELINKFIIRMENASDAASELSSLVDEFKACQRFTNGIDKWVGTNEEYDPTKPESRWAEYKRAGLYITSTDYSDVTMTTIESSDDSSLPSQIVKDRLITLYSSISVFNTFPKAFIDAEPYDSLGFMDKDGYSLLLVTNCNKRSDADFEAKNDVNERFTNIVVEYDDVIKTIDNIYNYEGMDGYVKGQATINQITLFVYEYLTYKTSDFFPSSVQTYITDYIMPIYNRYTGSETQRYLLYTKMLNSNIQFTDTANNARLTEVLAINERASDNYLEKDDQANLFPDWWTEILKLGGTK